jgi:hypothetical protein
MNIDQYQNPDKSFDDAKSQNKVYVYGGTIELANGTKDFDNSFKTFIANGLTLMFA